MAKSPEFTSPMESISPVFQPIASREGLIAAGATENLAESAQGMFKSLENYQRGQVTEEVRQGVEKITEQYNLSSPAHLGEVKTEIQQLQDDLSNLAEPTPGQEDLYKQNILSINKKIGEKTAYLEKAYSQGLMSEGEFKKRLGLLFKETSGANPFFKEEIKSTINDVLYANNMAERLKFDEKYYGNLAKQQEDFIKDINTKLGKYGLAPVTTYNEQGKLVVDYEATNVKLLNFEAENETVVRIKLNNEKITSLDDNQIILKEQRGEWKAIVRGYYNNMVLESTAVLANGKDWTSQKMAIEGIIRRYQFDINAQLEGRPDNAIIKSHADFFKVQSESLLKSVMEAGSGESAKTFLTNKRESIAAQQQIGVMNEINLAALDAHGKLAKTLTDVNLLNLPGGQEILTNGMNILRKSYDPSTEGLNLFVKKEPALGTSVPDKLLFFQGDEVAKQANGTRSAEYGMFVKEYENSIIKTTKAITELESAGKYADKSNVQTRLFITMADPKLKGSFKDVGADGKTAIENQFKDYSNLVYKNLDKFVKDNPKLQLNLTVMDDGTLVASGPGATKDFNSTIISRINTSLKAYANLQDKSTADVAKEFYGTYFNGLSTLGTEPTPSTQPAKKVSMPSASGGEDWSTWSSGMIVLRDQPELVKKAVISARENNTPLTPDLVKVAKYLDKQNPGYFDKGVTGNRNTKWLQGQKE
jgi:hypothetical protein